YNSGQYTAALRNLLDAYKNIPDDPYLNNSLGLVYMAKDRYNLAENHFKKSLSFKSDYIQAKNNLGAAYLKQKKWDLAIHCFEEISENLLYATPEIPLSNLGWAYFHQKLYKTAKTYFEKSLEFRPDFLIAVHGLASIYIETGYYPHAIKFLHHALEKNPGAAILHSDLAKVYEALKEFNKAKKSWEVVIKIEPATSPLAREAEKRLLELN
ncbi:MAG: tetratricopeptide repeat protein, partial [Desulfobacterales bacterium]|nr:tetratricopeptide repeat protein [Desulfobacterales bacterium]